MQNPPVGDVRYNSGGSSGGSYSTGGSFVTGPQTNLDIIESMIDYLVGLITADTAEFMS